LGLDELREKLLNKNSGGGGRASGTMNLAEKKDFVTPQAILKQQGKDIDLAPAIHQKEVKKRMCNRTLDLQPTCSTAPPA
jgi:hypothetical protein